MKFTGNGWELFIFGKTAKFDLSERLINPQHFTESEIWWLRSGWMFA
jgi:hypothetical protein